MDEGAFLSKEERYEMIVDSIVKMIYSGSIKKGDRLMSENQMAKKVGVSRAHVREVYSALNILGIVESRRGEGTFFEGKDDSNMLFNILFLMLYNESVTVNDIMELRKIMEIGIAEKAAVNRNEKDIKDLKRCLQKMEVCNDGNEMSVLDSELHSIISRASGNYLLMSLSQLISGMVIKAISEHWTYIIMDKNSGTKRKTFEQHKDLVESIINKKPYIAKVIAQEHLEFVSESLDRYKKDSSTETKRSGV